MKSKITRKLVSYFAIVLIIFTIVISILFTTVFINNIANHHKEDIQSRAQVIADTLAQYMNNTDVSFNNQDTASDHVRGQGKNQGQGGFGVYLKMIDDIAMSDIWLVDSSSKLITTGQNKNISYAQLPEGSSEMIQSSLEGNIEFSENFSRFLGVESITVSMPIKDNNGQIYGAIVLHSPVDGTDNLINDSLRILFFSLLFASILSVIIAILLSKKFVKPVKQIHATSQSLIVGDYTVNTEIHQNDEIGELASTIDTLSERLLLAQDEQEKMDQVRQDFYTDVSHELRTPVTVLRGSLEMLSEGRIKQEEKINEYHQQMLSEIVHLQKLVNDLLDFSKLQNTDYKMHFQPINMIDIIFDVLRSGQRLGNKKQISIKYTDHGISLISFFGDYERVRQMFMIVMDNAIKFSDENSTVSIEIQKKETEYMISITNNGIGITENDLPHIFNRFYKSSSDKNKAGTGIGLAIAKQIADRHTITLSASSVVNKETVFSFFIKGDQT